MSFPTDRPLYGTDVPRRELTEAEKDQLRALHARIGSCCGGTWEQHILPNRCAHCDDCRGWRPQGEPA